MTAGLFDEPEQATRPLSDMYSAPAYRASAKDKARYTAIKSVNPIPCDECFANQHEAQGRGWPRAQARTKRSFKGGPKTLLNLCSAHAELWRERDAEDTAGR